MDTDTKKTAKSWGLTFVKGAFAVALALLFILVLRSIAVQITPPPESINEPYPDTSTEKLCEEAGGRWVEGLEQRGEPVRPAATDAGELREYCKGPLAFERERTFQAENSRETSLFVFAVGGAMAVAGGLLIRRLKPVAPGLMIGGIVAFFITGIHIWQLTPGIGRLVTIVVIFVILTGVGLHVFKDKD